VATAEGLSRVARAGALYQVGCCTDEDAAVALAEELGRHAASDPYLQRFLLDVSEGKTSIPPRCAAPAFLSWARLDPGAVTRILESDTPASVIAGLALGRAYREFREALSTASRSPRMGVRLAAAAGLAEAAARGSFEATETLAAMLGDADGQVRWSVAARLGAARGDRCVRCAAAALEGTIAGSDERAVTGAIFGLARLWPVRQRKSVTLLNAALTRGNAAKRAVALAIRQLPFSAGGRLASAVLADTDPEVRALGAAAYAAWAGREPSARQLLTRLATDPHSLLRAAAAEGLAALPEQAEFVEQLAADALPTVRAAVAQGLLKAGCHSSQTLLTSLARDPSPLVRAAAAAGLLPEVEGNRELLVGMTTDRDTAFARAAVRALGSHVTSIRDLLWDYLVALCRQRSVSDAAAEAAASVLDANSAAGPAILWRWALGPETRAVFGRIARTARSWQVAEVARTLERAVGDMDESAGLDAAAVDHAMIVFSAAGERDIAELLSWLPVCVGCADVNGIGEAASTPPRSTSQVASLLATAGQAIGRFSRTCAGAEGRELLLARANAILEAILERPPDDLESLLIQRAARAWREVLNDGRSKLLPNGPLLRATLASRTVVCGPRASVAVLLENTGPHPVTDIELACGDGSEGLRISALDPGEFREVEAPCHAPESGVVTVKGRVTYRALGSPCECSFGGAVRALRPDRLGPVANPYVAGKPLGENSPMFFGRTEEIETIERAVAGDDGAVVVVVGQRRTGKTSLLKQLVARLSGGTAGGHAPGLRSGTYRPYKAAFIDMQGLLAADTDGFLRELARPLMPYAAATASAGDSLAAGGPSTSLGTSKLLPYGDGDGYVQTGVEMVREVIANSGQRIVLLLDEFDDIDRKVRSGRLEAAVLDQLRHLVQHNRNVSLVLSGTHRLEELGGELWSFLLNLATYRRVGCLGREDAEQVLREPLARLGIVCEDAAVARAVRLTGGHPYFLQLLGYRIVENCVAAADAGVWTNSVDAAADEVVEQGDIHLRYLWESAGELGRPVVKLLAERDTSLAGAELQEGLDVSPERLAETLDDLLASEVVLCRAQRYSLRMELLGRWLRSAGPSADRKVV